MIIYFKKDDTACYQILPVPSDLENWIAVEVEDKNSLINKTLVSTGDGQYQLVDLPPAPYYRWNGTAWEEDSEKKTAFFNRLIQEHSNSIDATASNIASHWTRFSDEYYEREEAAKAFAKANFEGEPSVWITGFAQPAGLDNKTATQLILKQAEQLKSMLAQLGALRMRKYELKAPNLTAEQLQAIHDDIISKMTALAETMV